MSRSFSIGQLKAEPLNRLPEKGDIVQWINVLQMNFFATVINIENDEVEFRNYFETSNPFYCFTKDLISRLIVLKLYLVNENGEEIGTVSKNVIKAFLENRINLNDNVWYEVKNSAPRIHKRNLICKA